MHESLQPFHPVIARWFEQKLGIPTPPQILGWPVIAADRSALILAPTGSGKTLAAFLAAIDWLAKRLIDVDAAGKSLSGVQILYISPLKSLANDVQKNLLRPLTEIADTAAQVKIDWPDIQVAVRTGDTTQKDRSAIARHPPHILITTPESLNLMLTTAARGVLVTTRFAIIDEVHALAGNKRGVFLALLLERLEEERNHLNPGWQSGASHTPTPEAPASTQRPAHSTRQKIAPGVYIYSEPLPPLIRIGLSATARPEKEIARWLAGNDAEGQPRPIQVLQTGQRKRLDLQVVAPYQIGIQGGEELDAANPNSIAQGNKPHSRGHSEQAQRASAAPGKDPTRSANPVRIAHSPDAQRRDTQQQPAKGTGHWPEVTRAILQMIRDHKSTLVFGNSRRLIENLASRFQEVLAQESETRRQDEEQTGRHGNIEKSKSPLLPLSLSPPPRVPLILPHHGSIAKEVRLETEQALKRGELDAVLATSSLELGIDIGSLDLVIQIDSPGNVAAGLQRVGRAGHLEKSTAKGRFIARGSYELAGFGALLPLMLEGRVEETRIPANCLDVLAQQIVAACVTRPWKRPDLFRLVKRAAAYRDLTESQFDSVVAMLSQRAQRVTAQGLRPRLSFDRVNDELIILPGSAQVLLLNGGVISDTGQYPVYLAGAKRTRPELTHSHEGANRVAANQKSAFAPREMDFDPQKSAPGIRLGELDEEFVYETKEGDRIILGSQTWRVVRIDADRVLVEHADPGGSRMPFWRGERPPRSEMLGEAVATFHGELESRLQTNADEQTLQWLIKDHHFDDHAAENAIIFFRRQIERGALPTTHQIVVEHFTDRAGEPIIAILCPLGTRVNYAIRLALEGQFARRRLPAQIIHNDDGLIIRPPAEIGEIPENPLAWLRSTTLEHEIVDQLEGTALFGLRFRQNAARALMLPRMALTQRTPLWQQRLRARHLLALVKRQRNFPIIIETYRECLQDALNIPQVVDLLQKIEAGTLAVKMIRHPGPGETGSPLARSLFSQFMASYLYAWDDPLVAKDLQPTVDQRVLDDILHRRAGREATAAPGVIEKSWTDADEETLRRRIWSLDYPARSAEELLGKIESAGALGVPIHDDPRWEEWTVGGLPEARVMLTELLEKRRILNPGWQSGASRPAPKKTARSKKVSPALEEPHYIATENLALLLAAQMKFPKSALPKDLPPALLQTTLDKDEARRLIVEQLIKSQPTFTPDMLNKALPWMAKEAARHLEALQREARVLSAGDRLVWHEYAEQLRTLALRRERRSAATVDVAALQSHLLTWQHVQPASTPLNVQPSAQITSPLTMTDAAEDILDLLTGLSFPLDFWEHDIFPARLPNFSPSLLDGICKSGHRVWVGSADAAEPAIAFWPRHLLAQRLAGAPADLSASAKKVQDFLQTHGASFQFDIQLALTLDDADLALALRELASAGLLSCDDLANLRDIQRVAATASRDHARQSAGRATPRPARLARNWWKHSATPAGLGGRWFLLPATPPGHTALDIAQRAADRTERFLRRTGFACRELTEPADGTWKDNYDVLTRMEWAGAVRRGYFVDGISGAQFAAPNAALLTSQDSSLKTSSITWLSMLDPANLWARASTRWITDSGFAARVPRAAGTWIALLNGRPVLAATAWGQRLIPLPASAEEQHLALSTIATLLPRLPKIDHPYLAVRTWDQQEILGTPAEEILYQQGFTRDTQGLRLYRQYQ